MPLDVSRISTLAKMVPEWTVMSEQRIAREFVLPSFMSAISWVVKVAEISEAEDHHPTIEINFAKVRIELTTHSVKGLSENDFILAAKLDRSFKQWTSAELGVSMIEE
jgi:4a-hydroxytetrahydrobiopterin dehydratase